MCWDNTPAVYLSPLTHMLNHYPISPSGFLIPVVPIYPLQHLYTYPSTKNLAAGAAPGNWNEKTLKLFFFIIIAAVSYFEWCDDYMFIDHTGDFVWVH